MSFQIDAATSTEEVGVNAMAEAVVWSTVDGTLFVRMISVVIFGQCKLEDAVTNLGWDSSEQWAGGLRIVACREGIGETSSRHGSRGNRKHVASEFIEAVENSNKAE